MKTQDILKEIQHTKEITHARMNIIKYAVKHYEDLNNMTLHELLVEAEYEEDERIPLRKRKLKQRLLNYKTWLIDHYEDSTSQAYLSSVKTCYKFYELELPHVQTVKIRNKEYYNDIPTKRQIIQALNSMPSLKAKAVILFMATSGCARTEVCNLTIQDFINATDEYHNETGIANVISKLSKEEYIIPTWYIHRQKTDIYYITFCTPEATNMILAYLRERMFKQEVHLNDKLFDLKPKGLSNLFVRVNDKNNWGFKGNRRFFHSHALRKFFATQLQKLHVDIVTTHFLLGHRIDRVTESYVKADPNSLKLIYMKLINDFQFIEQTRYHTVDSKEKRELKNLREKTEEYESRLNRLEYLLQQRSNS